MQGVMIAQQSLVGSVASARRRCMSRPVFRRFCHARPRVANVFGPFHYCAFRERAAPDAPETIDDQRRCTGCRYQTIYGGSRGSASLPLAVGIDLHGFLVLTQMGGSPDVIFAG